VAEGNGDGGSGWWHVGVVHDDGYDI